MSDDKDKKKHKPTMLIMLLISFAVFTFFSFFGSSKAYGTYTKEINIVKEPALTLFFRGLHDGVAPWSSGEERKEPVNQDKAADSFFFHIEEPGEESLEWEKTVREADKEPVEDEIKEPEEKYGYGETSEIYFKDAIFIGDSRTDGLAMYSSLKTEADFLSRTSLSVYHLFDWDLTYRNPEGAEEKKKITDILSTNSYKKVYLSVGINELGTRREDYLGSFREAVRKIKELQPEALIIVQAIMRVTSQKSASDPTINNQAINDRNQGLFTLAEEEDVFYIDLNEAVSDESGGLRSELTNDGVHLKASEYGIWVDFLKDHAVMLTIE